MSNTSLSGTIRNGNGVPDASLLGRRVLIVAPTGNDAELTAGFLSQAKLGSKVCRDVTQLAEEVKLGCGAIVLAEETLGQNSISVLIQALAEQPVWSDIPIILITSGGEVSQTHLRRLAIFGPGGNVTLLERPFRPITLVSTLEVALRSRQRQYEACHSVEELKQAHDEIQIASRAKDDFLAALSHELRTPLNPVLLIASENAGDPELPEKMRGDFEMIRKNIELEARLIDDLLDLTRISRGKLSLNQQVCDVHDILRDALNTNAMDIQHKKLSLQMDLEANPCTVLGDAVRLQQVFWNVLKNAVKFTPAGGSITVQTGSLAGQNKIVIRVTDTGIGMAPTEIARVFNAFTQGDHASDGHSHRFGGLGLGLAISSELVRLHHGVIQATSPGPGCGSTFTIEFPTVLAAKKSVRTIGLDSRDQENHSVAKKESDLHILLVEDHEPTRVALTNLLKRREYKVFAASSVAEAQVFAARRKFDLVISDIGLPDGNGYELMSQLRDDFGLKGIALTGYGMEQDVARGQSAGFISYLIKPVRIEALDKILSQAVKT
jgi:signal transduction histidine kinase